MPGLVLQTSLDRDKAFSAAAKAARDLGYTVETVTERQFTARRSNLAMSLLLPPFTPYCNFLVTVLEGDDGGHELVLQRNNPWWTGYFGLRAVKSAFDQLLNATEDAVEAAGGKILGQRVI
jgi:hypothetical protein